MSTDSEIVTETHTYTPGDNLFNQSFDIIKDAMKDVKHEMVITLEDDTHHIVYIHGCDVDVSGRISLDFSTPSTDRKDELGKHVEAALTQLALNEPAPNPRRVKKSFFF
ncbi:head vertex assembly chaperone [Acinetobacter phage ZZ1]|jgi:hypothetical protein|uniref:Head vertex assembly chaperone n=3 Tax=Caudoviricetes TaxID=2731619 RepID=A0A410T5E2_9CAUD|nr:head vertex assembly chaperone [Acinetobacter phage ZZ1]AFL47522.1 head vertex assembly chaperone [Acinetobacter phage ZZ1]QAU03941.1 head vertex assembly chaperone [Acinetobacter phage Henu6]